MITLDFRDSRPVYEQICEKIKNLIVSGIIKSGDKIMSVRDMAAALTINPNTIVKAYKQLEQEGYIYSVQGRGYFVAEKSFARSNTKIEALTENTKTALKELCFLGVKKEEISKIIEDIWKGRDI
ncbi:MAG: GntR family transcriptional regulator [Firmicutes bacterium]|nr:GntR family transcriptional regulator [Bacillota bacterium]HAL63335.1 GntR family transcriptional regulator [Clostridiales bacterium]